MRFVNIIVFLVLIFFLVGCAVKHVDLVAARRVALEVKPEGNVSMSSVAAHEAGERLHVTGSIGRTQTIDPFSGWVQVTVVLENGTVFEERCSRVWPPPIRLARGPSSFDVTLPTVPPPGSMIRVTGSTQVLSCT